MHGRCTLKIWNLLLILYFSSNFVNSLSCYECKNCDGGTNKNVISCLQTHEVCYMKRTSLKWEKGCGDTALCDGEPNCFICRDDKCNFNNIPLITTSLFLSILGAIVLKFYY